MPTITPTSQIHIPTIEELETLFNKVNEDIAKDPTSLEQIIPLTDAECYAEQIHNIYKEYPGLTEAQFPYSLACKLADELAAHVNNKIWQALANTHQDIAAVKTLRIQRNIGYKEAYDVVMQYKLSKELSQ